jgi:hypothetical protein
LYRRATSKIAAAGGAACVRPRLFQEHMTGNEVLAISSLRPNDLFGRIGGEEFAIEATA